MTVEVVNITNFDPDERLGFFPVSDTTQVKIAEGSVQTFLINHWKPNDFRKYSKTTPIHCRRICNISCVFRSTGPIAVARRRSVGPSVRPSTPVTRQPIFRSFSKSVRIFLG